jgi:hypothetical protein
MSSITFDTLGYARQLKDSVMFDAQAEIIARNTNDVIRIAIESAKEVIHITELATKKDIKDVELLIEHSKNTTMLWIFSIISAQTAIIAKGLHWF